MKRFFRRMFYYPILAICSRRFYVSVISRFRGVSAKYFLEAVLLSSLIITCYFTVTIFSYVESDLRTLLKDFPSFTVNKNWEFEFLEAQPGQTVFKEDQNHRKYVSIQTPEGTPVLLFNPDGAQAESQDLPRSLTAGNTASGMVFHVTFGKNRVSLFNGVNTTDISYRELGIMPGEVIDSPRMYLRLQFMAYTIAPVVIFISMYIVVALWLAANIAVTAALGYGIFYLMGVRTTFITVIRVNVYANTIILTLFTASMFMLDQPGLYATLHSSYFGILPLIYNFFAASDYRRNSLGSSSSQNQKLDSSGDDSDHPSGGGSFRP